MTQPAPTADPVGASCCDTVRDLIVRGVWNAEIHRRSAIPILEALGFDSGEARDLVYAAEEASA